MADLKEFQRKMEKTLDVLASDFAAVRAGRANAQVLDRITVEYYGQPSPINQVGTVSSPDPRTLVIQPWDTTLLRAIGYEADQQILEIFDLADEVKVTKANLKKAVGRKLAARVLSTWVEDFVDEDTGEVVSIERNNVIVDRETVLQEEHVEQILESGAKTILLHKENLSGIDFSIIYNTLQKDPCNS